MRKAAQKPPRRPERGAPAREEKKKKKKRGPAARLDPTLPPPPPPPLPRAALLLVWPKSGYHPSLFEEDLPGSIRQLRCSRRGSLVVVVKADREVVAFEREEEGEEEGSCRRSPPRRSPESFKLTKKARVDSLDCQASHLLILSSEGKLYEHNISSGSIKSTPRLLEQLGNKQIIQVTCGDHHSMAFSKGGELFAWGQNEYGQLGINRKDSFFEQPQLVQDLEGIPLANITAGSAHSMALSLSGSVYSWGKNTFGQLGLGDTKDRYRPTYVAAMEHMKTVIISCGGEHTAVLSKDGLVSTFGAGSHGQLGHNSTRNELLPRLVAELFGAHVSQVACGRWHTLVYVPKLGEVYSFGSGAEGQLGNGKISDQRIPLPLNLTMNGQKIILKGVASEEMVKIIAGENQSVVLLLKEKNSYATLNQTLAKVEEEKVEKWVSNSDPHYWKYIQQEIELIFSSAACINGSFLEKREKYFTTYWKTAGVDLSAVLLFYEKIAAKSKIFKQVIKGLGNLLKSSHSFPDSPEALRVFIIVPFLLRKQDIKSDCLLIQLAEAIANLSEKARQILECLWSNLEVTFFKDLVGMYQKLVCVKLSAIKHERRQGTIISEAEFLSSADILQMLYEVNCKAGVKIHESNFYISEAKRLLSPPNMSHIRNEEQIGRIIRSKNIELQLALNTLSLYPWMFDLEDKIFFQELSSTFLNISTIPFDEMSILHVRRQYLIQDTWQCLRGATERWFLQFLRESKRKEKAGAFEKFNFFQTSKRMEDRYCTALSFTPPEQTDLRDYSVQ